MRNITISLRRWTRNYTQYHSPRKGDKVVVSMSGGVDSSVTACLLAEKDYDLSAMFMRNWDIRDETGSDQGSCEWEKDWEDVQRIDLTKEFWNNVFQPALHLWGTGATPNPDVWCNREIKFGALLNHLPLTSSGKTWLATGHYAIKSWVKTPGGLDRPQLHCASHPHKDQSYYLSSILESSLQRTLFPLGYLDKRSVRDLAKKYRLHNAERDESMGICFVGEKSRFSHFLASYLSSNPGPMVDETTGKVVAQHDGIWNFTIGEGARIPGFPEKLFVSGKNLATNTIHVVPGTDNPILNCVTLYVSEFYWIWKDSPPAELDSMSGFRASVKHRYRMEHEACTVYRLPSSSQIKIDLDKPNKSVSPGQVATLYTDSWCLGCGIIERTS